MPAHHAEKSTSRSSTSRVLPGLESTHAEAARRPGQEAVGRQAKPEAEAEPELEPEPELRRSYPKRLRGHKPFSTRKVSAKIDNECSNEFCKHSRKPEPVPEHETRRSRSRTRHGRGIADRRRGALSIG